MCSHRLLWGLGAGVLALVLAILFPSPVTLDELVTAFGRGQLPIRPFVLCSQALRVPSQGLVPFSLLGLGGGCHLSLEW